MHGPINRRSVGGLIRTLLCVALVAGLAGRTTAAGVSYGEYQFGPGYQAGRVYENRVYAGTEEGIGSENCRTILRGRTDASGRTSSTEEILCR